MPKDWNELQMVNLDESMAEAMRHSEFYQFMASIYKLLNTKMRTKSLLTPGKNWLNLVAQRRKKNRNKYSTN